MTERHVACHADEKAASRSGAAICGNRAGALGAAPHRDSQSADCTMQEGSQKQCKEVRSKPRPRRSPVRAIVLILASGLGGHRRIALQRFANRQVQLEHVDQGFACDSAQRRRRASVDQLFDLALHGGSLRA